LTAPGTIQPVFRTNNRVGTNQKRDLKSPTRITRIEYLKGTIRKEAVQKPLTSLSERSENSPWEFSVTPKDAVTHDL
jgi:hypothetical protein